MDIRAAQAKDVEVLLDVWLRSVRATHSFVSEEDIQLFLPLVEVFLRSNESEIWVLRSTSDQVMGFMGLSDNKIEALFLAPEFLRRGGGRRLVLYAQSNRGELTVDVNEQNVDAVRFYRALGFIVEGRSELDDTGRPYPLLHMRLGEPSRN